MAGGAGAPSGGGSGYDNRQDSGYDGGYSGGPPQEGGAPAPSRDLDDEIPF